MGGASDRPDVGQLAEQEVASRQFPAPRKEEFRVFFASHVHEAIARHAAEDTSIEICGVLVGRWGRDPDGPFVEICQLIRCDSAASRTEQVTFTHDTWAEISQEMDTRFADLSIVGWYHSHPDFGVFLSQRDGFIHEHFFSGPGQVAYVVDPVRKAEGVFVWKDGQPVACSHYWVGNRIYSEYATGGEEPGRSGSAGGNEGEALQPAAEPAPTPAWSALPWLLGLAAVFFVGYLLARVPSNWQQRRMLEGVVTHFGVWKVLRPGLRERLEVVDADVQQVSTEVERLASQHVELAGEKGESTKKEWERVEARLLRARRLLAVIAETYCFNQQEAAAFSQFLTDTLAGKKAQPPDKEQQKPEGSPAQPSGAKASGTKRQPPAAAGTEGGGTPAEAGGRAAPEGPSRPKAASQNDRKPEGEAGQSDNSNSTRVKSHVAPRRTNPAPEE